jgi:hypothetical protein
MKPFSAGDDAGQKRLRLTTGYDDQTTGFGHASRHPQRDLSPFPQKRPSRHGEARSTQMIEAITGLCIFLSIGVFLAHAFDAFRMR